MKLASIISHALKAWPLILAFLPTVAEAACSNGTESLWITSQFEADELSSCDSNITTRGIIISSDNITAISLPKIVRIDGFLAVENCSSLESISAPDLQWINNEFRLNNLPLLANLSFPGLESIGNGVFWKNLPLLSLPTFQTQNLNSGGTASGTNIYGELHIEQCGFDALEASTFATFSNIDVLRFVNNPQLKDVNFTDLTNILRDLEITGNHADIQIVLPRLESVFSMNLKGVASIDVSQLSNMGSHLTLIGNSFSRFFAPKLSDIGGHFIVTDNRRLVTLDFPVLETIGGGPVEGDFNVTDNPELHNLVLPKLAYVDGNTTFIGSFESISLAALEKISDGFNIVSSTTYPFNCTAFDQLYYTSEIAKEEYSCAAYVPGAPDAQDIATHYTPARSKDSGSLPRPAMLVIIVISVIVGLAVATFLIRGFCRKLPGPNPNIQPASTIASQDQGVRMGDLSRNGTDGRSGSGSEDKLPPYRRVGRPGEVPPGYEGGEVPAYDAYQVVVENGIVGRPPLVETSAIEDVRERELPPGRSRTLLRMLWPRFAG